MKYLTLEEIKAIPEKSKTMTAKEIADEYGVHERTINGWARKLRAQGIEVHFKKGRKPIDLTQL